MSEEEEDGGEKLQVDRKRLEAMITGQPVYGTDITLPNAADFFAKVESLSGARVLWPNQLKIGAKTKKDPYVKLYGTVEQVDSARQLISATLQRRRDRVTLKILITCDSHSHLIGRGGRGSKKIMQETACHIHFPDSNRYLGNDIDDPTKCDQVSITGSPCHTEKARTLLRENSLIVVSFEIPWYSPVPPPLPTLLPQVTAAIMPCHSSWIVSLRAPERETPAISESVALIATSIVQQFSGAMHSWTPELRTEMRLIWLKNARCHAIIRAYEMAHVENVRIHFCVDSRTLYMAGNLQGMMAIRQFVTSQSPVSLHFDCPSELIPADMGTIEQRYLVDVVAKRKNATNAGDHTAVVIKSTEDKICTLLQARERILRLEETPAKSFSSSQEQDDCFMKSIKEPASSGADAAQLMTTASASPIFGHSCKDAFRSPDPEDSPIAHSLLMSAKELNKNAELWRTDRIDRSPSPPSSSSDEQVNARRQMMLKATRAVLDASFRHIRYPTDLWSGYGFSSSLPAELIKAALDESEQQRLEEESTLSDTFRDVEDYARQAARKMFSPSSGGLASVLEDEELSAYDTSMLDFSRKQRIPSTKTCTPTSFSTSTSLFEAAPTTFMSQDLPWDVDVFVDPSMVLAQLGCSEYLPQFRAHEMDMRALLLSDEQSLKEIGVATVGARKKIAHAILMRKRIVAELRESARSKGYDL